MAQAAGQVDFSAGDGHGYVLSRGHTAACRLNLQSYLWKDALGFNIHPCIHLGFAPCIADIASGTGLWLIDVARSLEGAQLDGFDIDLTQAPHQRWLPPNISMTRLDIFEDIPDNLVGKYDLVHARLLVGVVQQADPVSILQKFLKMLKPGGYLQWDDLDFINMRVKRVSSEMPTPAFDQLREMIWSHGRYDWLLKLADLATRSGFVDAKIHLYGDRDDLVRAFNDQHLMTMDEFALHLTGIGKKDEALAFHKVVENAYQESLNGAAICIPRVVCTGRKPPDESTD